MEQEGGGMRPDIWLDASGFATSTTDRMHTIDTSTTYVTIADPEHRYDVSLGDEHICLTAREAFEALARLMGLEVDDG